VRRCLAVLLLFPALLLGLAEPAHAGRRRHAPRYRPPVEVAVRDPFRAPACRFCAGNRGFEYATAGGETVRASAAGTVTFAGQVGGELFVVVQHPDGLRTTYGLLTALAVGRGAHVAQGQPLGTAGPATFFGVRRGEEYLDPALVLGGAVVVPRLVPTGGGPGRWPR
jgi:murein DD-endopeptidase MepM/ murein hydrolase activator NlpD